MISKHENKTTYFRPVLAFRLSIRDYLACLLIDREEVGTSVESRIQVSVDRNLDTITP